MPGPYTKGAQNAETLGDLFVIGDIVAGTATIVATTTLVVVTHGLSAAPDWFMLNTPEEPLVNRIPWVSATTATTFTIEHSDTDGALQTVYYLAGNLS